MTERRKLERYNLIIPTRIVISNNSKEGEVFEINTCDISAKGAYFKTKQKIKKGSKVALNFVLPVNKLAEVMGVNSYVKVKGEVVRVDMEGIAVSFSGNYKIMPYRNFSRY
jgi:hypothetical protein